MLSIHSNRKSLGLSSLQEVDDIAWNLLIRQRLVNPNASPESQGYRVIDRAANLPTLNMATRYGITTSLVATNDANDRSNSKTTAKSKSKTKASKTSSAQAGPSNNRRTIWSQEEELLLVQLRCDNIPFRVITRVSSTHLPAWEKNAANFRIIVARR